MFAGVGRRSAAGARAGVKVARLAESCAKLLTERGQAVSVSLAREVVDLYATLDRQQQAAFFQVLLDAYSPDPAAVVEAAQRYGNDPSPAHHATLYRLVEPPRQELFRRVNRAPGGTAAILQMRTDLLQALPEHPALTPVDTDFRHLLASWFNPGFLQVVRLDWRSPAHLLERIIAHDAVHEVRGWEDLRRRLESDRRCFGFFHPVLPDEPLIFVEVALMDTMPVAIDALLAAHRPRTDAARASVAALYSINTCQPGLRGVSLGNFLVKQVVEVLAAEFPRLRRFCTLSPIPGFGAWLAGRLATSPHEVPALFARVLARVEHGLGADLSRLAAESASTAELLAPLRHPLETLCASYLLRTPPDPEGVQDPVARFHLNNGARLERINWLADTSRRGLKLSLGMMANYVYDPTAIEANHDRFVQGRIMASRQVTSMAIDF